jgi:hypothetical protein
MKASSNSPNKRQTLQTLRVETETGNTHSPTIYPLKVQAIRSKDSKPTLYVYLPIALAAAIGLEPGESVQWELLDRGELHLVRHVIPPVRAKRAARKK